MKTASFTPEVRKINRSFEAMSNAIKDYDVTCSQNGSPLRSVTFRRIGGETKTHVTFRRK